MDKTVSTPISLAIRNVENALVASVNEVIKTSGLPCSVIELIFDKIHRQLKDGVKLELETERRRILEAEELEREAEIERAKVAENFKKEEEP